jgi:hypothetical protein
MGGAGNLPASVGNLTAGMATGIRHETSARIVRRHRTRSVGQVARRHRLVAFSTRIQISTP